MEMESLPASSSATAAPSAECSACRKRLPEARFSNSQLKKLKKAGHARCISCITNAAEGAVQRPQPATAASTTTISAATTTTLKRKLPQPAVVAAATTTTTTTTTTTLKRKLLQPAITVATTAALATTLQRKAATSSLEPAFSELSEEKMPKKKKRKVQTPAAAVAAEDGRSSAPLTCDKCDGPHATASCPHFKKPREKHPDAQRRKQALAGMGGGGGGHIVTSATVARQPGDGSCLFHSMAFWLRRLDVSSVKAHQLRGQCAEFLLRHPNLPIAEAPIRDWVRWDAGCSVERYARSMRGGSSWGGGIEMAACSRLHGVNVHVYERKRAGFVCISQFDVPGANRRKTLHVLYQGGCHYDALVPKSHPIEPHARPQRPNLASIAHHAHRGDVAKRARPHLANQLPLAGTSRGFGLAHHRKQHGAHQHAMMHKHQRHSMMHKHHHHHHHTKRVRV